MIVILQSTNYKILTPNSLQKQPGEKVKFLNIDINGIFAFLVDDCILISRTYAENDEHELAIQWSEVCQAEALDVTKKTEALDVSIKSFLYLGEFL